MTRNDTSWVKEPLAHAMFFAAILFVFLGPLLISVTHGPLPLFEPSEARYAEISREMAVTGDWLVPRLNGFKHLHKPPLTYWACASSIALFGANEWAVRLPLYLASLFTLWLTWTLGRVLFGRTAALIGTLVFASAVGYQALSRILATDPFLLLWCTGALTAAWLAIVRGRKRYLLAFYACLGLGFLTKGPAGIFIPLVPSAVAVFTLRWSRRPVSGGKAGEGTRVPGVNHQQSALPDLETPRFGLGWHLAGLMITALVAVPWFIALEGASPGALAYLIRKAIIPVGSAEGMHGGPPYYYLLVLLGGLFPWSLMIFPAYGSLFRRGARTGPPPPRTGEDRLLIPGLDRAAALFLCTASLGWLGFFSAIPAKLPAYILPSMVPFSLVIGRWLAEAGRQGAGFSGGRGIMRFLGLASPILMLLIVALSLPSGVDLERAGQHFIMIEDHLRAAVLVCILPAVAAAVALTMRRKALMIALLVLAPAGLYLIMAWSVPGSAGSRRSPRPLNERIMQEGDSAARIVNFRVLISSIPFYTGRRVVLVDFPRDIHLEKGYAEPPARLPLSVRGYYHHGPSAPGRLLREPARSLWVTSDKHMPLVRSLKPDVEVLLRLDDLVLFANQPADEAGARGTTAGSGPSSGAIKDRNWLRHLSDD